MVSSDIDVASGKILIRTPSMGRNDNVSVFFVFFDKF